MSSMLYIFYKKTPDKAFYLIGLSFIYYLLYFIGKYISVSRSSAGILSILFRNIIAISSQLFGIRLILKPFS